MVVNKRRFQEAGHSTYCRRRVTSRWDPGVCLKVHQQEHRIQFITEHSFVVRYCGGTGPREEQMCTGFFFISCGVKWVLILADIARMDGSQTMATSCYRACNSVTSSSIAWTLIINNLLSRKLKWFSIYAWKQDSNNFLSSSGKWSWILVFWSGEKG